MKLKLQIQHDETDCGAACMRMILGYFGKKTSLRLLREDAGTDTAGTSGYGLIQCAQKNGLSCKGFSSPQKNNLMEIPCPAIFHVIQNNNNHYVVAKNITKKNIVIMDPAEGCRKLSIPDFLNLWTGIFFLCKPTESFIKDDDSGNPFANYLYLLKKNKSILYKIIGSSFLLTVLGILTAFYFRFLIDEVLYSETKSTLNIISISFLIVLIFQAFLGFIRNQLALFLGVKIDITLICEFFNHLLKLPLDFFSSRKTGEILSRIRDTENIRRVLSSTTVSVLIDSVMIVLGFFFMAKMGSDLMAAAVIPVLISALVVWIFSAPLNKRIRNRAIGEANKNASMYETINGIGTIKALSTEKSAFRRNEIFSVEALNRSMSLETLSNLNGTIQGFLSGIGTLLIYWVGSYKIFSGEISLGQLISFVTLSSFFLGPLRRLLTMQPQLQEATVSAERLTDIFKIKEEDFDEKNNLFCEPLKDSLKFEDISFSYGSRGNAVSNINFSIQKGEKIGIVGASGSGKSTLVKLLMKFYKPSEGKIFFDNYDISQLKTEDYRKLFGYVPQEPLLFSGTIAENIAWGLESFTPSMIQKAAKESNALNFITSLPAGFNTMVGENGTTLSGGERQRIALARILIRNPEILILDEATASLDSICEKSVMEAVNRLHNKTIIMIAHKLSTVAGCDRIVVMDKGRIVESGSHEELLSKKSVYKKLWEAQYEN